MSAKRKASVAAAAAAKKSKPNGDISKYFSRSGMSTRASAASAMAEEASPHGAAGSYTITVRVPSVGSVWDGMPSPRDTPTPAQNTLSTPVQNTFSISIQNSFPTPVQNASPTAAWNKETWVQNLSPETRELLKLEIETMGETWLRELKDELVTEGFLDLKRFLKSEKAAGKTVFPAEEDIYSWSRHTPLSKLRVVIIGQDPYHYKGQAHGLAFSVRPPLPPPPSLKNIFINLKKSYPEGEPDAFRPPPHNRGDLTAWTDRGVLLLNTCLTVRQQAPNSHNKKGWEKFTKKVIDIASKKGGMALPGSGDTGGLVFLAWGTSAAVMVSSIDSSKHLILRSVHPSPLSAYKGWFEQEHFKVANAWLKQTYGDVGPVKWDLGEEETPEAGV